MMIQSRRRKIGRNNAFIEFRLMSINLRKIVSRIQAIVLIYNKKNVEKPPLNKLTNYAFGLNLPEISVLHLRKILIK